MIMGLWFSFCYYCTVSFNRAWFQRVGRSWAETGFKWNQIWKLEPTSQQEVLSWVIYFKTKCMLTQCQSHKMLKRTNNSSAITDKLFECVWPFCGVGAWRVNFASSMVRKIRWLGKISMLSPLKFPT